MPWRDWDALEAMPKLLSRLARTGPWDPSGKLTVRQEAVGGGEERERHSWSVGWKSDVSFLRTQRFIGDKVSGV